MFGLFKSKEENEDHLYKKYKKLLDKSYKLSTTNRAKSDHYSAEADKVLQRITEILEAKKDS